MISYRKLLKLLKAAEEKLNNGFNTLLYQHKTSKATGVLLGYFADHISVFHMSPSSCNCYFHAIVQFNKMHTHKHTFWRFEAKNILSQHFYLTSYLMLVFSIHWYCAHYIIKILIFLFWTLLFSFDWNSNVLSLTSLFRTDRAWKLDKRGTLRSRQREKEDMWLFKGVNHMDDSARPIFSLSLLLDSPLNPSKLWGPLL